MGDDLWISLNGSASRQIRKVLNFVPHPKFSSETMENDIGVIRVSGFSFGSNYGRDHIQ